LGAGVINLASVNCVDFTLNKSGRALRRKQLFLPAGLSKSFGANSVPFHRASWIAIASLPQVSAWCAIRFYGILFIFHKPVAEPFGPSYPTWQHEMSLRRPPELWEELSFLYKPSRPWNPLAGSMGFDSGEERSSSRCVHQCPAEP
jgi:hypothetical protein